MQPQYLLFGISMLVICCVSQTTMATDYRLPPADLVDLIDAPPSPGVNLSPNGKWMLMIERSELPGIDDLSRRMLRLAGLRIDPVANSRFRTSYDVGLSLRKRGDSPAEPTTAVPLPPAGKLASVRWAHDSKSFAFTVVTDEGTQLWVGNVETPTQPRQLTDRLNMVLTGFSWLPDAQSILCCLVPQDRPQEPAAPTVPAGPNVQETIGETSPTRTYQDLLTNAHEEDLFDHYATTELTLLGLDGSTRQLGEKAVYAGASPAPDGKHLLVTTIERPYSYLLTVNSFPKNVEVWNTAGQRVHLVAAVPLAENIPIEGVRTGPRMVDWMSSRDATLIWSEALDGGDPRKEVDHRDQWMMLAAPFKEAPAEVVKVEQRAWNASFTANPDHIITYEYDRDRRWIKTLLHDLQHMDAEPKVLTDRSIRDRYGDPGRLVTEIDDNGHMIVKQEGPWVYRAGSGATPEGMLPFLDRQHLETLESERLWRCEKGGYETMVEMLDSTEDGNVRFVTSQQSKESPPNYFLRDTRASAKPTPLTNFPDPTPQIRKIKKQLVKYQRDDGVELSATLYLPADYQEGQRLPLIIWAYPTEFNDASTAGQVGTSPWLFTRIRGSSHLAMVTQGYAVMDGATIPIIGDPETMNDTFVEQMVAAAQAAIDKAVEMGVADRDRVAVGGHSYGAFMTANLLAHCNLFKAGIARSGAYNRTLTPFGFQSERRPMWEAKDVYFNISPFMHADKITAPLLLTHGEEDNNSGTFPTQSKRLFQAIKGNGGTARLVLLPKESHGYRARESVLHVQAETLEWLDRYVKHAEPDDSPDETTTASLDRKAKDDNAAPTKQ